jgi:hypothetical protein
LKDLYLFSLLGLLVTEYGFRSRSQMLHHIRSGWGWTGTAIRAALWLVYGLLAALQSRGSLWTLLFVAVGAVLSEIAALLLRRFLKSATMDGSPHGSVRAHLSAILLALLPPVGLLLLSPWVRWSPVGPPDGASLAFLPWAVFLVALWAWATMVTVSVIDLVRPDVLAKQEEGAADWGRGEVIGVLERLITFALIAAGSPGAVGLVVAAKAAARFPEFKDAEFAEYFLVGTLTSVGVAVALGLIMRPQFP